MVTACIAQKYFLAIVPRWRAIRPQECKFCDRKIYTRRCAYMDMDMSGKVRFTPRTEITTTIHTAKTRQFAGLCHALLYNFPELLVLSVPTGTLTSYMERPPHHTSCVLDDSGKNLTVCTKNKTQSITPVDTMVDCDQVASRALFAQVHCAAHPTMTRITQIWTGTCRWKPRAQALNKIASRLRHTAGIIKRDQRSQNRN